jgi:hypothetical protein
MRSVTSHSEQKDTKETQGPAIPSPFFRGVYNLVQFIGQGTDVVTLTLPKAETRQTAQNRCFLRSSFLAKLFRLANRRRRSN